MKVEMDSGTKSEGEEDSQAFLGEKKTNLGRTPNHLTLSTTSTISAGSTGSQARLIQSSHQPENYQPITVKELGEYIHCRYSYARLHTENTKINSDGWSYFLRKTGIIVADGARIAGENIPSTRTEIRYRREAKNST